MSAALTVRQTAGKSVNLPFTMPDLVTIYMALPTDNEREAFWQELGLRLAPFTDEQKALFALSCVQSLEGIAKSVKQSTERIEQFTVARSAQI